jgi:hypothetical protein
MGWWSMHLGILSTLFGKLGPKQVGPTEGRQPGVCMNHRSYHLHMPAHPHVVSSRESVRPAPCPDSPSHSQKALKVVLSTTLKLEATPVLLHCRRTHEQIVWRCTCCLQSASLPFRMLMSVHYL